MLAVQGKRGIKRRYKHLQSGRAQPVKYAAEKCHHRGRRDNSYWLAQKVTHKAQDDKHDKGRVNRFQHRDGNPDKRVQSGAGNCKGQGSEQQHQRPVAEGRNCTELAGAGARQANGCDLASQGYPAYRGTACPDHQRRAVRVRAACPRRFGHPADGADDVTHIPARSCQRDDRELVSPTTINPAAAVQTLLPALRPIKGGKIILPAPRNSANAIKPRANVSIALSLFIVDLLLYEECYLSAFFPHLGVLKAATLQGRHYDGLRTNEYVRSSVLPAARPR